MLPYAAYKKVIRERTKSFFRLFYWNTWFWHCCTFIKYSYSPVVLSKIIQMYIFCIQREVRM